MKKSFIVFLTSALLTLMTFVASVGAQPKCWGGLYQPEVPECLRK